MGSIKLKEDEVYFVVPGPAEGEGALKGLIFRDTVCLDEYFWSCDRFQYLLRERHLSCLTERYAVLAADRSQRLGLLRKFTIDANGFSDEWTITNPTQEDQEIDLGLSVRARMIDLFSIRADTDPGAGVTVSSQSQGVRVFRRTGEDGVTYQATLTAPDLSPDLRFVATLPAKTERLVRVRVDIESSEHSPAAFPMLPSYENWLEPFAALMNAHPGRPGLQLAAEDLRALLIRTESGPYPAAGMPIFVNLFGRDALIAGMMVSDWQPAILKTVLEFLAKRQGKVVDPFREEEPGKILHEIRRGELSRTNKIPFGRYYGSVDSTPLFIMAAADYLRVSGDTDFIDTLGPNLDRAMGWLLDKLEHPSGLATFHASGSGLTIQSWKDSSNSMVDEHGQPAKQPIAVAEVQGYCFAALMAFADIIDGRDPVRAKALRERADHLRRLFHDAFWLDDLGTYAMALDADGQPLRVLSSDPGHLLWTGIVYEQFAERLARTMLSPALWSGWGVRTLGQGEVAYNPVSYHNGSVWPHDTALFGMGLYRYGFHAEAAQVALALLDLADACPNCQIPEVISGFARQEHSAPVGYTHANAPQAWAAAGLIRMASYVTAGGRT
jgi:glycogen debranching enzyme